MFERCRRTHAVSDNRTKRLAWDTYIPDQREGEHTQTAAELPDKPDPLWFKVQSYHGYKHPSVVLVEEVVRRDDVPRVTDQSNKDQHSHPTLDNGKIHGPKTCRQTARTFPKRLQQHTTFEHVGGDKKQQHFDTGQPAAFRGKFSSQRLQGKSAEQQRVIDSGKQGGPNVDAGKGSAAAGGKTGRAATKKGVNQNDQGKHTWFSDYKQTGKVAQDSVIGPRAANQQSSGTGREEEIFAKPSGVLRRMELDAGQLINSNSNNPYAQVQEEEEVGHENYITTHKDYHPMEHIKQNYNPPFSPNNRFGVSTCCDRMGQLVHTSLQYPTEKDNMVSKRLDDYRQKFQLKIGQPLDPIKDTMWVGPDHTFGLPVKMDGYGAWELMYNRLPKACLQERDLQQGLIATMRQTLKGLNYHCFPDLIHAFRLYDKEGMGRIDKDDVREVCINFGMPVDPWLLEQVLDYCDEDQDRQIDYIQFARFLDWKDRLPEGFAKVPIDRNLLCSTVDAGNITLNAVKKLLREKRTPRQTWTDPGNVTCSRPGTAAAAAGDAGSARLQREIDHALADHRTSAQMVHAAAGPTGLPTTHFRASGIPNIRSDLVPPRERNMDDRNNYGESTARDLIYPSVYSRHGVYEKHLLSPRSKQELKEVLTKAGVESSEGILEAVYRRVSAQHPKGHVSVQSFRNALDQLHQARIAAGTHPLAL